MTANRIWDHSVTYDRNARFFSRGLAPMATAEVYLLHPLDLRDSSWGYWLRTGTKVILRPYPTGEARLLSSELLGTVLLDGAKEGIDFSFDPVAVPVVETFTCGECGKQHSLLLDDKNADPARFIHEDGVYAAFHLGGGKNNRGLKSLGWIIEKAKFFTKPSRDNGDTIHHDQTPLLACPECAPEILKTKQRIAEENAQKRLERAQRALEKARSND